MFKQKITLILFVGLLVLGAVWTSAETVVDAAREDELIAVLKSADGSRQEKTAACRLLTFIATKKAVPALAALLADPEMNHMARYALEPLADASVDDAFLAALSELDGMPRIGVIGSIGVRGDKRGVGPIAKLLTADAMTAQAAARALGNIGDSGAAKALSGALAGASGDTKLSICEGMFRCAESLGGRDAVAIYDQLRELKAPHQVRAGGLKGAILTRRDGFDLLQENLKNSDYIMFSAAVQTTHDMPGAKVTKALADQLGKLSADNQVLIIGTLAVRGDAAATAAISKAAGSGDKAVRIAAIEAMPSIGDAASVPVLIDLLDDSDGDVAKAAQANLAAMSGKKVDAAVMAMLSDKNTDTQLTALDLIERRRMSGVAAALLKATKDDDESVRAASIRMLGDLGGDVKFATLVKLLVDAGSSAEIRAAERALSATCTRDAQPSAGKVTIIKAAYGAVSGSPSADVTEKAAELVKQGALEITASNSNFGDAAPGIVKQFRIEFSVDGVTQVKTVPENGSVTLMVGATPQAYVDSMCAAQAQAAAAKRLALLRVLRGTNNTRALQAVRSAMTDREIGGEATSMLCDWPTADALADVQKLSTTATDAKTRIIALRGVIRLIPLQSVSDGQKIADFKKALPLITRDEEKRLLLGVLPAVATADSLAMAMSYVDDAGAKTEACFSAVAIADKIAGQSKAAVTAAMGKVLKATDNADVKKGARQALDKAK